MNSLIKKMFLFLVIFSLFLSNTISQEMPLSDDYYKYNNPFERDLDTYKFNMNTGSTFTISGLLVLIAGVVAGTIVQTSKNAERIDADLANRLNSLSYAVVGLGASSTIVGFIVWKINAEKYYETLKLETRYYNLITR